MTLRTRIALDGQWQFWIDPENSLTPQQLDDPAFPPESIFVPSPWQSQSDRWRTYNSAAWYRRQLDLPLEWFAGESIILSLYASDYFTQVWLNGAFVGDHEGGYLPFEFELSQVAHPGTNDLVIRVDDPPSLFAEIPHGKQGWYGPLSGLWQSVWAERRYRLHMKRVQISSHRENGLVDSVHSFSCPALVGCRAAARIFSPEGELLVSEEPPHA